MSGKRVILGLFAVALIGAAIYTIVRVWPTAEVRFFPRNKLGGASFYSEHRDTKRDATQVELKGVIKAVNTEGDTVRLTVMSQNESAVVVTSATSWFCAAETYTAPDGSTHRAADVYLDLSRTWSADAVADDTPSATEVITDRFIGKTVQVAGEKTGDRLEAKLLAIYGCP